MGAIGSRAEKRGSQEEPAGRVAWQPVEKVAVGGGSADLELVPDRVAGQDRFDLVLDLLL